MIFQVKDNSMLLILDRLGMSQWLVLSGRFRPKYDSTNWAYYFLFDRLDVVSAILPDIPCLGMASIVQRIRRPFKGKFWGGRENDEIVKFEMQTRARALHTDNAFALQQASKWGGLQSLTAQVVIFY